MGNFWNNVPILNLTLLRYFVKRQTISLVRGRVLPFSELIRLSANASCEHLKAMHLDLIYFTIYLTRYDLSVECWNRSGGCVATL